MNLTKIGEFIFKKRQAQNLTQSMLAEKLGVSNRSVSNWENGKNLPDVSLFKPLCQILNITLNELLNGENIKEQDNQNKFTETITNIYQSHTKKNKRNQKLILILSVIIIVFLIIFLKNSLCLIETTVAYDERLMKCDLKTNYLTFDITGLSTLNTYHITREISETKYYFLTTKIFLSNKIRSHFETWDSMSELASGKRPHFGYSLSIEEPHSKVKVYYTQEPLSKIKKMSPQKLKNILDNSKLICQK